MNSPRLVVVETHPVQYHAPVYRELGRLGVPVTAIYGSDFSVAGYTDPEFQTHFAWDTDLLSGYRSVFVSRVAAGGATDPNGASIGPSCRKPSSSPSSRSADWSSAMPGAGRCAMSFWHASALS